MTTPTFTLMSNQEVDAKVQALADADLAEYL
jgi:hypothetical protein